MMLQAFRERGIAPAGLRHIAVQILEFSLAFESARRGVRSILFNALEADTAAKAQCEQYLEPHEFRNLDHFLDYLVHDSPFAALVIIDELPDRLESVLINRFRFGVEVLEVARYEDEHGERFYRFKPFLADVSAEIAAVQKSGSNGTPVLSQDALDTIVVPAREDGFQEVFLGENKWYSIRISGTMIPQIKYIAAYQVAPRSAITYMAPVVSIEPSDKAGKYCVNFAEPAHALPSPITLVPGGHVKALQNLRYTNHERLEAARTLDEVWQA